MNNGVYEAKTVIIATGRIRASLAFPGEKAISQTGRELLHDVRWANFCRQSRRQPSAVAILVESALARRSVQKSMSLTKTRNSRRGGVDIKLAGKPNVEIIYSAMTRSRR